MNARWWLSAIAVAGLLVGATQAAGDAPTERPPALEVEGDAPTPVAPPPAAPGAPELAALVVAPEADAESYERDLFGQRWKDVDRNGCGQRDDVLDRDLTGVVTEGRCVVVAGTLVDPYTGETVAFAKADAALVPIDHVVPLVEAWSSGAASWDAGRREAFANDLRELQATTRSVNSSKAGSDAGEWLPPAVADHCRYARTYVAVKVAYGLSVDPVERDALARALGGC